MVFILKEFAIQFFGQNLPDFRFFVIHVSARKTKCNKLSTISVYEMKFKSVPLWCLSRLWLYL